MTPSERAWLQEARRSIRLALVKSEIGDWDSVVTAIGNVARRPSLVTSATIEVSNLLSSIGAAEPSHLRTNAAMRAATIRRLEETKTFIGEALVATTDH